MEPDAIFFFPKNFRFMGAINDHQSINRWCWDRGWLPKDKVEFDLWAGHIEDVPVFLENGEFNPIHKRVFANQLAESRRTGKPIPPNIRDYVAVKFNN